MLKFLKDFLQACLKYYKKFIQKKLAQNLIFRSKFSLILF